MRRIIGSFVYKKWVSVVLLCSLILPMMISAVFGEEKLMREQISCDIPVLQAVLVEHGEVKVFVGRQLDEGELSDFSAPFQAGGMARVLTSLALIELLDEHNIEIDQEISTFLPNVLSADFEQITFKDLLLHRTGFVNQRFGTVATKPFQGSVRQRAEVFLASSEQRFPVGKYSLFSNTESALATILIEEISGKQFSDYMRMYFVNLGMSNSSVEAWSQNGGAVTYDDLLPRYYVNGGSKYEAPAYYAKIPAADDYVTTLEDMKNLLVHLTSKSYPKKYQVFDPVFTNVTSKVARSMVFNHIVYEGESAYIMDAALPGAFERMIFLPGKGVALYFYYNSDNVEARETLTSSLLSEYLDEGWNEEPSYKKVPTEKLAGYYSSQNISKRNIEKFVGFSHQVRVDAVDEGVIIDDIVYKPISETLFYNAVDERYVKFITDEQGRLAYLAVQGELYQKSFSSNVELVFIILTAFISFLILVMVIKNWKHLIAGRVNDRPRAELLVSTFLTLLVIGNAYYAVKMTTYWNIAYGGSFWHIALRYFGWALVISGILNVMTLMETRGDYKWKRSLRFLIYVDTILLAFFFFWLIKYRFLAIPFL